MKVPKGAIFFFLILGVEASQSFYDYQLTSNIQPNIDVFERNVFGTFYVKL